MICSNASLPGLKVEVYGYSIDNIDALPLGSSLSCEVKLSKVMLSFKEESVYGNNAWNIKPKMDVEVYPVVSVEKFFNGLSGSPVYYINSKVLGMFDSINENTGYFIPIEEILETVYYILGPNIRYSFDSKSISYSDELNAGNDILLNGHFQDALDRFESVPIDRNLINIINSKGAALFHLQQYNAALKCFEIVLVLNNDHVALGNKGTVLLLQHRYNEAIDCFEQVLQISSDPSILSNKALALCYKGNLNEALDCINNALDKDPNFVGAVANKGLIKFHAGEYSEALTHYFRATELAPNNPDYWNSVGLCYFNLNDNLKAKAAYDKALKLRPNYEMAWFNMGNIPDNTIDGYRFRVSCYEKAIESKPDYIDSYYNLADLYIQLGLYYFAYDTYQKIETNNDVNVLFLCFVCKINCGDLVEAIKYLQKARSLGGIKWEALAHSEKRNNFNIISLLYLNKLTSYYIINVKSFLSVPKLKDLNAIIRSLGPILSHKNSK